MYTKPKSKVYQGRHFKPKVLSNEESSIELEDDDPCAKKPEAPPPQIIKVPGLDPRFQQQDQTLRCYVMYVDFFHCEHILGAGHEACTWFKEVYHSICPNAWIEKWDEAREENRMAWHKEAPFPEGPYGK